MPQDEKSISSIAKRFIGDFEGERIYPDSAIVHSFSGLHTFVQSDPIESIINALSLILASSPVYVRNNDRRWLSIALVEFQKYLSQRDSFSDGDEPLSRVEIKWLPRVFRDWLESLLRNSHDWLLVMYAFGFAEFVMHHSSQVGQFEREKVKSLLEDHEDFDWLSNRWNDLLDKTSFKIEFTMKLQWHRVIARVPDECSVTCQRTNTPFFESGDHFALIIKRNGQISRSDNPQEDISLWAERPDQFDICDACEVVGAVMLDSENTLPFTLINSCFTYRELNEIDLREIRLPYGWISHYLVEEYGEQENAIISVPVDNTETKGQ